MSTNQTHGSMAIAEAHRRLETIKEDHKQQMFEDDGEYVIYDEEQDEYVQSKAEEAIGIANTSRHRLIADVCEEVQDLFPEPEPEEVRRFRSLVLSMDTIRNSADLTMQPGDPLRAMQNVAIRFRDTALDLIKKRLVLERPADEEDADVIYIHDPISKIRHTTALGGYREEYDKAMIEDQKEQISEQILYDPIPDTIPRV